MSRADGDVQWLRWSCCKKSSSPPAPRSQPRHPPLGLENRPKQRKDIDLLRSTNRKLREENREENRKLRDRQLYLNREHLKEKSYDATLLKKCKKYFQGQTQNNGSAYNLSKEEQTKAESPTCFEIKDQKPKTKNQF